MEDEPGGAVFTLAHLSDLHIGPPPAIGRYWNLKRLLGWLNWQHRRRHVYSRDVLQQITDDLHAQGPDHIAVTGDIANLGLPAEHEAALRWLGSLGPPERVTAIPGNHDIYSGIGADPGTARWHPHMSANESGLDYALAEARALSAGVDHRFPFVRCFGSLAIIAMNSAVPTRPFYANGRVGPDQLRRLATILGRLGAEGVMRVVLIHHPPLPGLGRKRHDLDDAQDLADVLTRHGAELVLHGHEHMASAHWHPGLGGDIPVIGVPSGSLAVPYRSEPLARYNLYRLRPGTNRPRIELVARGLAEPGGPVVELERRWIEKRA